MGLDACVALITRRALFGAVPVGLPSAMSRRRRPRAVPIALVKEGDHIAIDIPGKAIHLMVPEDEIERRRSDWQPPEPKIRQGYMARYARQVSSASQGAMCPMTENG